MKQRLRPGMIAVPAAALICALANREGASLALAAAALCGIVLSLGAGGALRRASGKLTSRQRFLGAGICALCMAAFGAIAGQALAWPLFDGLSGIAAGRLKDLGLANANGQPLAAAWAKLLDAAEEGGQTAPDIAVLRAWLGAGAGFAAGQCVWAMLEGQGSAKLAHAFDAVTFAALTCALLADGSAESALACATGALLVGLIAIFAIELRSKGEHPRPSAAPLREIPAALARQLLYPALAALLIALQTGLLEKPMGHALLIALLAGWTAVEFLRPAYRMERESSLTLRITATYSALIVSIITLLWNILNPVSHITDGIACAACLAAGCLLALSAVWEWRTVFAEVLLLAAAFGTSAAVGFDLVPAGLPAFIAGIPPLAASLLAAILASHGLPRRIHALRAQRRMHRAKRTDR